MNKNFTSGYNPPGHSDEPFYWFLFKGFRLLVEKTTDGFAVPKFFEKDVMEMGGIRPFYLGHLNGKEKINCHAAELPDDAIPPEGMAFMGLRRIFGRLDHEMLWIGARAVQLVHWNRTHLFCGRCGTPTENAASERAKSCPNCGLTSYPRISPAIIVRVTRPSTNGSEILLARAGRFPTGLYSVLAGFVEPGETLESCVQREICEEVGITVKNIRYFGSQPWPFPDSLMIAFTAEYDSGEIHADQVEILDAGWFTAKNLPEIPSPISIAWRLIDNWLSAELPAGTSH